MPVIAHVRRSWPIAPEAAPLRPLYGGGVDSSEDADAGLLRRIADRQQLALRELFDRYAPAATALAHRITADAMLAEDAVQEAFLSIWSDPNAYRPDRGTVRTFVFTIVHHRAVDRVRAESARRRRDDTQARLDAPIRTSVEETVVEAVDLQQDRQRIQAALAGIPDEQRQVVEMMYFDGLSQRQIAERLDIPLGTIKSRTLMAMRKLRAALAEVKGGAQ